jgi:hypothetical protein
MVDVLVAMNAAALKVNLTSLKKAERLLPIPMALMQKIFGWPIIPKEKIHWRMAVLKIIRSLKWT